MRQHAGQLFGCSRALDEPSEEHDLAAGDGERVHGGVVHDDHPKRVGSLRLRVEQPLHDRADRFFALLVDAAPFRRRDLFHGGLPEPLLPRHRHAGGDQAGRCGNTPHVEHRARRDRSQRRSNREEDAGPSPARVVKFAPEARGSRMQRRQKRGVVDQENLREGRAALQADLLAGVEALCLAHVPERPPETRAVGKRDLEPARSQAHRGLPARGTAPVEVVAREYAGHPGVLRETDVGAQET